MDATLAGPIRPRRALRSRSPAFARVALVVPVLLLAAGVVALEAPIATAAAPPSSNAGGWSPGVGSPLPGGSAARATAQEPYRGRPALLQPSARALVLAAPAVGMAASAGGNGYWLVASDGGIFSFGAAQFYGSMGGRPLDAPIVGMAASAGGNGYWLVASDGGIFSFGAAQFYGSASGLRLTGRMIGINPVPAGGGYWMADSLGQVLEFGAASYYGSASPSVLQVGDSISSTLGIDLATAGVPHGVSYFDKGILGCGIAQGEPVIANGYEIAQISPYCNGTSATQWEQLWAAEVDAYAPQVAVLLVGYWEIADRWRNGSWANITQPGFASYLRHQLLTAVGILHSKGAHVVLLTCPYFDQPDPGPLVPAPESSSSRVDAWNAIVDQMPSDLGSAVSVVNLNAKVDPGGNFAASIGGMTVRAPDGEHFPFYNLYQPTLADPDTAAQAAQFGEWIGAWLWPQLLAGGAS